MRDRRVQRLVEDLHDRANLVGRGGLLGPQRRGAPQGVDLLDHAALGAALVRPVAECGVELVEQVRQATDAARDGAAAGLGGVRGEHGVEAERLQALERGVVSDLCRQLHERRRDRIDGVLLLGPSVALAEDAHALVLLDEVDQVEVDGERAGDLIGALHGEGVGDLGGPGEGLGRLVGVRLDRRGAQLLDVVVEAGRTALAQHAPEEPAQAADIAAHPLGDLLAGFETSDEIDGLSPGEFGHDFNGNAAVFRPRDV